MTYILVHMNSPTNAIEKYKSKKSALSHMQMANRDFGYTYIEFHEIGDYISEWSYYEDMKGDVIYTYAPYRIILESNIYNSINNVILNKNKKVFIT